MSGGVKVLTAVALHETHGAGVKWGRASGLSLRMGGIKVSGALYKAVLSKFIPKLKL